MKNTVKEAILVYPEDQLKPIDFCEFVHLKFFDKAVEEFGFDDDDLTALQMMIMANPKGSPVIPGTGGIRKLRFSPPGQKKGGSSRNFVACLLS